MKKLTFNILLILIFSTSVFAQNIPQGMSYQAVARDAEGQLLTDAPISLKISLISNIERRGVSYSEIHYVKTNKYGLFSFTIGQGETLKGFFEEIPWETEDIWLEVAMDENAGNDFKEMNTTKLLTVPYAFHAGSANELVPINPNGDGRVPWWGQPWWNIEGLEKTDPDKHFVGNIDSVDLVFRTNNIERFRIKADGTILIPGSLDIGGNLYVHGDSVIFDNELFVGDNIYVENNITAGGDGTFLNIRALNNGTIDNDFLVGGKSALNGQVTIKASLGGGDGNYNSYPLRVEGSGQGIAIKANAGTPNNSNNFITFFDSGNSAIGRIEGETSGEATSTPEYIFETAIYTAEIIAAGVNIGLSALPNACAGVGAVACPPEPSVVAIAIAEEILAVANLAAFNIFILENLGVTYQSGSADYAEWLERKDASEKLYSGDIVGVIGGRVSKNTMHAEQYMVISTKPAILGNMPMDGTEELYEKVAFMGQIPVKVRGQVLTGDYILPSGFNDGTGIAVSPKLITPEQYSKIVGIAWSSALGGNKISLVNMAIGLNANDVARLAVQQEKRIEKLENDFVTLEKRLAALESGTVYIPSTPEVSAFKFMEASVPPTLDIQQIEEAILLLEATYRERGFDVDNHYGLQKLFNDESFRMEIIKKVDENYQITYQNMMKMEEQRK